MRLISRWYQPHSHILFACQCINHQHELSICTIYSVEPCWFNTMLSAKIGASAIWVVGCCPSSSQVPPPISTEMYVRAIWLPLLIRLSPLHIPGHIINCKSGSLTTSSFLCATLSAQAQSELLTFKKLGLQTFCSVSHYASYLCLLHTLTPALLLKDGQTFASQLFVWRVCAMNSKHIAHCCWDVDWIHHVHQKFFAWRPWPISFFFSNNNIYTFCKVTET